MSREDTIRSLHPAVVDAARALSEEKIGFLEGSRCLAGLGREMSQEGEAFDPDFGLFIGIDSELDHLPSAEVRSLCSSAWLDQCDAQERKWKAFYSKDVEAVCTQLISRFSTDIDGASGVLKRSP